MPAPTRFRRTAGSSGSNHDDCKGEGVSEAPVCSYFAVSFAFFAKYVVDCSASAASGGGSSEKRRGR